MNAEIIWFDDWHQSNWFYETIWIAIANEKLRLYGMQFHPEVDLTTNGKQMLKNFLIDISGLSGTFTMASREIECIEYVRKAVGNNKVLVSVEF